MEFVRKLFGAVICVVICGAASSTLSGEPEPVFSYTPPNGCVPDEHTATLVAEAVLVPIYGAKTIQDEKPFKAALHGGVWTVVGSMPPGLFGGVAQIEINKADGKILRISHGK